MPDIAIVWGNWGPYHLARFAALRALATRCGMEAVGIELFAHSGHYEWKTSQHPDGLIRFDHGDDEGAFHPVKLTREVVPVLRQLNLKAVLLPGYWHWSLYLNAWSRLLGARTVVMTDAHLATTNRSWARERLKQMVMPRFGAGLASGRWSQRFLAHYGLPGDRVFLGYDAVDNDHFASAGDAARARDRELRMQLGLPDRFFLNLGRFVPKKNLTTLVRAYAQAASTADDFPALVLVGNGESKDIVRAEVVRADLALIDHHAENPEAVTAGPAVHFYPFQQVDQTPTFFALAEAFVLPSLWEEWGLVVNEAMAAGTPVVVSDQVGSTGELVTDGETGLLFPPTDIDRLASHLQRLATDAALRAHLRTAGKERVEKFGLERFACGALAASLTAIGSSFPEPLCALGQRYGITSPS